MRHYIVIDAKGHCLGRGTLEAIKRCYEQELARIDEKNNIVYLKQVFAFNGALAG